MIAGLLIGAFGVLNDVTLSQASTVLALRAASPERSTAELYHSAMEVGRDHLGATVNTLVFAIRGRGAAGAVDVQLAGPDRLRRGKRETVATEIVAAFVGSSGLVGAVPLTTIVAALLAVRVPVAVIPERGNAHAH